MLEMASEPYHKLEFVIQVAGDGEQRVLLLTYTAYLLMLLTRAHGTLEAARACSHSLAPSIASSPRLHSSTYALATRQASFWAVPQSRVHCRTCKYATWLTQVTAAVHCIGICKICLIKCKLLLALSIVCTAIVLLS